ncbi:hypothetical protein [Evansella clarkii]|uniref:hypothetical protein n=1 Tax=Evansella clarkii TaxID=79879 RepID=UPI00099656D1|nr:hypothetical protein [Evansella clarkii]
MPHFDFSNLKEPDQFQKEGYRLQAMSTNGNNHVTSYIAKKDNRRVYGYYNYQDAAYIEEPV